MSMSARRPPANPALLAADLLQSLDDFSETVRDGLWGLELSLKPLMIDPLWKYIEATGSTESRDAALALVEVAEDVQRHVAAGNMGRASLLADRFEAAVLRFRASFDYMVHTNLPRAQAQRREAGTIGGRQSKRSHVRQLLVTAFAQQRAADPAMKKHDALVALITSPAGSLRVTKAVDGWRIEDQDADHDAAEELNDDQTKDLWKAAGQEAKKKSGK